MIGELGDYALVQRNHVGTSDQRRAAVRVLKLLTGSESWDAADAIVEAWLARAPAPDQRIMRTLTGAKAEHVGGSR